MNDNKMNDNNNRKKAIRDFKESDTYGGIYCIKNKVTGEAGQFYATTNMHGQKGKLDFAKSTNICPEDIIDKNEWEQYGSASFELVEVELLKKQPEQATADFRKELNELLDMYLTQK